jgi:two-component sensor histidine kinase
MNSNYCTFEAFCVKSAENSTHSSSNYTFILAIKTVVSDAASVHDKIGEENHKVLEKLICNQHEFNKKLSYTTSLDDTLHIVSDAVLMTEGLDFTAVYITEQREKNRITFGLNVQKGCLADFFKENNIIYSDDTKWSDIDFLKPNYFDSDALLTSLREKTSLDSQIVSLAVLPCFYNNKLIALILTGSVFNKSITFYVRKTLESISFQTARVISRIKTEKTRRQSAERYKILSEITSDFAYSYTIDSKQNHYIEWLSEAFKIITGFEKYEYGNIIKWEHIVYPDDLDYYYDLYRQRLKGISIVGEYRIYTKDMKIKTIRDIAYPQLDPTTNTVTRIIGAVQDISKQKKAENDLKKAAKERKTLLQEVHHRVKNNLQIISSLLDFQANAVNDSEFRKLLQESQNRVLSMSFVHEQLYRSHSLSEINMLDYITSLSSHLANIYNNFAVKLTLNIQDISFSVDKAIPCGLIINELLTNSYTHAFSSGITQTKNENIINLELSAEDSCFLLQASDNGSGFNYSDKFREKNSLGLKLISMLVNQLEGNIKFSFSHGTICSIRFPANGE